MSATSTVASVRSRVQFVIPALLAAMLLLPVLLVGVGCTSGSTTRQRVAPYTSTS